MAADLSQSHAKGSRVEDRGSIGIESIGQPIAHGGHPKHAHGSGQIGLQADDGGQHGARGVVEDAQHVKGQRDAGGQHNRDRAFGIGLPDVVRCPGDKARPPFVSLLQPLDALVIGMGPKSLSERALADLHCGEARTQKRQQEGKRHRRVLGQLIEGLYNHLLWQLRSADAAVRAALGPEGFEPACTVVAYPAIRGRQRHRLALARGPQHRRATESADDFAPHLGCEPIG